MELCVIMLWRLAGIYIWTIPCDDTTWSIVVCLCTNVQWGDKHVLHPLVCIIWKACHSELIFQGESCSGQLPKAGVLWASPVLCTGEWCMGGERRIWGAVHFMRGKIDGYRGRREAVCFCRLLFVCVEVVKSCGYVVGPISAGFSIVCGGKCEPLPATYYPIIPLQWHQSNVCRIRGMLANSTVFE